MEFRITKTIEPVKGAMKHVALLDAEGTVEIHEELPAEKAQERYRMLCLQVELCELEGKPGYSAYIGDDWPIPEPAE
jgi:hypothetical protein